MKKLLAISFILLCVSGYAQNSTIEKKNDGRDLPSLHRIMIIPFEQRLYMSEIDQQFNAETSLSARQIRHAFRDGLNEQIYLASKGWKYGVVDLLDDTVKYRKDLEEIYRHIVYTYMKVPDQEHYRPPVKEKEEKKINKGQLTVETNADKRFMNAKFSSRTVIPDMYRKHKTDLFIIVNQLDIKAGNPEESTLLSQPKRKISVHYTVLTHDGKEINSGLAEESFDQDLNVPRKIVSKHFSKIAQTIVTRINKGLGVK